MLNTIRHLKELLPDLNKIEIKSDIELFFPFQTFTRTEFIKNSLTYCLLDYLEKDIKKLAEFGKEWVISFQEDKIVFTSELYEFNIFFSVEDNEYVTTCTRYPSLSCIEKSEDESFYGLLELVKELENKDL